MFSALITHAGFFIAGGIATTCTVLVVGYRVIKGLYRRIARGY